MKLVLGALLLAASPCLAQEKPSDLPSGAATQYLASEATMNAQAALYGAIPRRLPGGDNCPGGAEEILRHQIESLAAGQPDYDAMEPQVADQWRAQIDTLGPSVRRQWGPLVSLTRYSRAWGPGTYEARFKYAIVRWQIACRYGKIAGISFKTLSQSSAPS